MGRGCTRQKIEKKLLKERLPRENSGQKINVYPLSAINTTMLALNAILNIKKKEILKKTFLNISLKIAFFDIPLDAFFLLES